MDIWNGLEGGIKRSEKLFLQRRWAQQEGEFDTGSNRLREKKSTSALQGKTVSICGFAVDFIKIVEEIVETNG